MRGCVDSIRTDMVELRRHTFADYGALVDSLWNHGVRPRCAADRRVAGRAGATPPLFNNKSTRFDQTIAWRAWRFDRPRRRCEGAGVA